MSERQYGYVNRYGCQSCGWSVVTRDVGEGVTPFMIACQMCDGWATSQMYSVDQSLPHEAEWRHEIPESRKDNRDEIEHHRNGGLSLYYLDGRPDVPPRPLVSRPRHIQEGKPYEDTRTGRRARRYS